MAKRCRVPHESLKAGDPCPCCHKGKLYELREPGIWVFIKGQSLFAAEVWEQMKFFPADMQYRDTPVNRLNNQQLVLFFEQEWSKVM